MQEPVKETPVSVVLDQMGIPYQLFTHPGTLRSLEQAAQERGQRPEQVVRSILFRLGENEFVMVLVAGPRQISWPALRQHLGVSRITMASQEEVLENTGYPLGAVAPFGLPKPVRILVDEGVYEEGHISLGSGVRYTAVMMQSEDLRRALGEVEVGCFVEC